MDNKLRRKRSGGGGQSSWKPRQLSELDKLPKPWHIEYWTDTAPLREGSSLPFTLRPLSSNKLDPLLDGKVGALRTPPSLPKLSKPVGLRSKTEENPSLSSKFSFDQMVLAREKALSSQDKSPTNPVEPKKPCFKYSALSLSKLAAVTSAPVVCKKQEVVAGDNNNNKTVVGNNNNNNNAVVGNNNNNSKTVVGNNNITRRWLLATITSQGHAARAWSQAPGSIIQRRNRKILTESIFREPQRPTKTILAVKVVPVPAI